MIKRQEIWNVSSRGNFKILTQQVREVETESLNRCSSLSSECQGGHFLSRVEGRWTRQRYHSMIRCHRCFLLSLGSWTILLRVPSLKRCFPSRFVLALCVGQNVRHEWPVDNHQNQEPLEGKCHWDIPLFSKQKALIWLERLSLTNYHQSGRSRKPCWTDCARFIVQTFHETFPRITNCF